MRYPGAILPAFISAALIHAVGFSALAFSVKGSPADFMVSISFLGSILRKDELTLVHEKDLPSLEPSFISVEAGDGIFERFWHYIVAGEKPLAIADVSSAAAVKAVPPMISGVRVELGEENISAGTVIEDPDLKQPAQVRLRFPQP